MRNGKSCQFFSVPAVSGIDGTVACGHGKVTRKGKVPPFSNGRPVQFELVVSGANGMSAKELTVRQLARPAPSAKSHVVFRQSGSGSATTSAFAIPGNAAWAVDWSYGNCTLGGGFNFDVYSGNLPDFNDVGPLDLNASGSGAEEYFDSGVFYFQIITSCSWSIEVTDLVVPVVPASTTSNVSATLKSSVPGVDENGGQVTLTANVHHGQLCTFLSDPPIAGLDGKSRCGNGAVTRQGQVPADSTTRTIYFEVVVAGATGLKAAGTSILQRAPQTLLNTSGSGTTTTGSFVDSVHGHAVDTFLDRRLHRTAIWRRIHADLRQQLGERRRGRSKRDGYGLRHVDLYRYRDVLSQHQYSVQLDRERVRLRLCSLTASAGTCLRASTRSLAGDPRSPTSRL